jgi:hypothetical protein
MQRLVFVSILLLAFGLATRPARGNDSSAELAAGGLVLVSNAHVEMRSEDLFISTEEIRVRYVFHNTSGKDVVTLVAFPMPDVDMSEPDANFVIPTQDPENLVDFSAKADGKPIALRLEQKVFAKGIERTDVLRKYGIPLAPHLEQAYKALEALNAATQEDLIRKGLIAVHEYDDGNGMQRHLEPRWILKSTYYWDQTFPAGRDVVVEHRYKPVVGGSAGTMVGSPGWQKEERTADYEAKYCIDADFLAAVERARKAANVDYAPFTEERIAYILKTAANWAGPIGDFRLVVDKGSSDKLVSFCGTGVHKISATAFEFRLKNYVPTKDFYVLLLKRLPPN